MFSCTWSTRVVAGMAQVTAGCETMNLSRNCAQLAQSISAAQPGSGWRCELSDQLALAKRPVDDDADAALPRQRQDAVFDLAVEDVVGDLNEIERLRCA